jgi:hypothetical protein
MKMLGSPMEISRANGQRMAVAVVKRANVAVGGAVLAIRKPDM